ncbi:MAG: oxidoreductase [Chloroflexota bacterium]
MENLFKPYRLKGLTLKNRIIMAPMATNMGADGAVPSAEEIAYYRERAAGGAAMVIVEAALANYYPGVTAKRLGLWSDDFVAPLSALAGAIAEAGAVPAIQICDLALRATNRLPVDLTVAEIETIAAGFVPAVRRARAAGFAVVEIHGAHSTTLADFLSRRANRRGDAYGGGEEGRAKLVIDIVKAVRQAVGDDYPLFCRINGDEYTVQGNTLKHSVPVARRLLEAGVDVIHVSAGSRNEDGGKDSYSQYRGRPAGWCPDGANVYLAAEVKRATGGPVIAVGKLGEPSVAEAALASGSCDLVALGRPLLADPNWPRKVEAGRTGALKRCKACDRCMEIFRAGEPLHCVTFAEA